MAQRKINAIVFDLGDTLLNFGKVSPAVLFKEGGKLAYDFLKNLNQPVGSLWSFLLGHLTVVRLIGLWSNIIKRDFDSIEVLKKINQKRGVQLSDRQWQDFAWCWYEPLARRAQIETDIKQTLAKLKQAGIKLGILSNTFINAVTLDRHLAQLGILDFFDVRLYSYQFKFRKPDRRIFEQAAAALHCAPADVLFVGDRIDTDITGALKANMPAAIKKAYTNTLKKIPANVIKIDTLSQLIEIVEKEN